MNTAERYQVHCAICHKRFEADTLVQATKLVVMHEGEVHGTFTVPKIDHDYVQPSGLAQKNACLKCGLSKQAHLSLSKE